MSISVTMVFNAKIDVEQMEYSRANIGATLLIRPGTTALLIITVVFLFLDDKVPFVVSKSSYLHFCRDFINFLKNSLNLTLFKSKKSSQ